MALTSVMQPSPTLKSAFSPYTDSPSSPAPYSAVSAAYRAMQRHSGGSNSSDEKSLHPPPQSPYPATVDPSPVESHNSHSTEATEIDEEAQNHHDPQDDRKSPDIKIISPALDQEPTSPINNLSKIDTSFANRLRSDSNDDAPPSVIHAPAGFRQFVGGPQDARAPPPAQKHLRPQENKRSPPQPSSSHRNRSVSAPSETSTASEATVVSPQTPEDNLSQDDKNLARELATPLNTQVPPLRHGAGSTPRASTKEEAEEERKRRRLSTRSNASNASTKSHDETSTTDVRDFASSIDDNEDNVETMGEALRNLNTAEQEIERLKSALSECWTLCNTLAGLSAMHRERMFSFSGTGDMQEQAWRSCWRLCQKLYESRDEDHSSQVRPTLELCRDFCQALFEARHRGDEVTDSILRVSFELNNHLYNTHDRNLPDAFRERTLDFYLTMCHRLMKQRTSLPEETDALLRACWSLAEMLFSLRQNNRDKKPVDEELLGSAVQACWELCDLFREGWTQIRPERGTPRPVQRGFPGIGIYQQGGTGSRPNSALSVEGTFHSANSVNIPNPGAPETPTTIFDDRDELSPSEPQVPNILVLGPENRPPSAAAQARAAAAAAQAAQHAAQQQAAVTHTRWTSNGSVSGSVGSVGSVSGFSDRTARSVGAHGMAGMTSGEPQSATSSNAPSFPESEDPHLVRLKALIVKAAMNHGFAPRQTAMSLPAFIKTLSNTGFGAQGWQTKLFEAYRKLVLTDPTLRERTALPIGRRFSATEVARAVQWMGRSEQFGWFRDLYRLVFGFVTEEASSKKGVGIQL